jgi:hypothetical protein
LEVVILPSLRPGDLLLYAPSDPIDWVVAIKTWHRYSHCEVFDKPGDSLASRNGIGVDRYDFRKSNLSRILRPPASYNHRKATEWFDTVRGQGYDWAGLLCFTLAVKQGSPTKQFCSEFACNLYRAGGFEPFELDVSADTVAPCTFIYSGAMTTIWKA